MNLAEIHRIIVLNKADLIDDRAMKRISRIDGVLVSARTGQGIRELVELIRNDLQGQSDMAESDLQRLNFA